MKRKATDVLTESVGIIDVGFLAKNVDKHVDEKDQFYILSWAVFQLISTPRVSFLPGRNYVPNVKMRKWMIKDHLREGDHGKSLGLPELSRTQG